MDLFFTQRTTPMFRPPELAAGCLVLMFQSAVLSRRRLKFGDSRCFVGFATGPCWFYLNEVDVKENISRTLIGTCFLC